MNNDDKAVGSTGQTASKASEQVATRAQDTAERLKSSAQQQIGAVKERAETSREHAAERIRRVSSAVRGVGHELKAQDDTFVARYADSLSDGIERVADYVGSLEPGAFASDAARFARNKPAWFFGGAFLAGLAAGRFLKSSRPGAGDYRDEADRGEAYRSEGYRGEGYDRWSSPERFGEATGQGYARGSYSRTSEEISTRGVFDADERTLP